MVGSLRIVRLARRLANHPTSASPFFFLFCFVLEAIGETLAAAFEAGNSRQVARAMVALDPLAPLSPRVASLLWEVRW